MSFVPTIERISAEEIGEIPGLEGVIQYWAESPVSAEAWFRKAGERWGCGLAMRRDGEILGFLLYGPPEYLPRAAHCSVGVPDPEEPLLAYLGGDPKTQRRLLLRMLGEMRQRRVAGVGAVSSDVGRPNHPPTDFLLACGWQPVRQGWSQPYTLMRADLGSAIEVGELARGLIGKVRLPKLRPATPSAGAFARKESPAVFYEESLKAGAPQS
ncbi:MAG: hypothetical protein WA990_07520 [Rubrobacteraceae bacterium]